MKQISFLLIIFITAYISLACLNEFNLNNEGKRNEGHGHRLVHPYKSHFDKREIDEWLDGYYLDSLYSYDLKFRSDIAVQYIKLGKFEIGLQILKDLVREFPNVYQYNSNLGTVYELLGNNQLALKYIKKGLEINPDSHHGSEWIHVKILEAKIAMDKNPNWLNNHTILNIEAHIDSIQKATDTIETYRFRPMIIPEEIDKQLRTRIPFVPKPDLITCLLFKETAELTSKYESTSLAHGYALMANYYAPTKALKEETEALVEENKRLTKKNYKGDNHISLEPFRYYLDESSFVDGVNGVNWKKSTLTKADYELIEKSKNNTATIEINDIEELEDSYQGLPLDEEKTSLGWLIAFILIIIGCIVTWVMVNRNSKKLLDFDNDKN